MTSAKKPLTMCDGPQPFTSHKQDCPRAGISGTLSVRSAAPWSLAIKSRVGTLQLAHQTRPDQIIAKPLLKYGRGLLMDTMAHFCLFLMKMLLPIVNVP